MENSSAVFYPKLDATVKKIWVEALRSGKYQQSKGGLRTDDKFCCLGVLCDLSELGSWTADSVFHSTIYGYEINKFDKSNSFLPALVENWAFSGNQNLIELGDLMMHLTSMNDHSGLSFPEIADWIDENL